MIRFAWFCAWALIASPLLAAPVPVNKAETITDLPVPASSMIVVQVNGTQQTRDKIVKLLEKAAPDLVDDLKKNFEKKISSMLNDRDITAIDKDGRILLAISDITKIAETPTPLAVVLPVSDYKGFREKFLTGPERKSFKPGNDGIDTFEDETSGSTVYLVEKAGALTYTQDKDVATAYAEKFDKLTIKQMGTLANPFLNSEVAVYLNLGNVNEKFGQEIQQFRQLIPGLLQQGAAGIDKNQLETARVVFEGMFQAVQDGRGLVLGISLQPEGARLRLDVEFTPESISGKLIAESKVSDLAGMKLLPKGKSSYKATSIGKGFMRAFVKLQREFVAADGEDKSAEAIEKFLEISQKNDADVSNVTDENGTDLFQTNFADSAKYSDALLKVVKTLTKGASFSNIVLKEKPVVKEADQKYGEFKLHLAKVVFDYDATVKNIEDENLRQTTIESMKKLMPEKMNIWFGTDGKSFLRVFAKDWDSAKKLLDDATKKEASVATDKAFLVTRNQLPPEVSYLYLVDTGSAIDGLSTYLSSMAGSIPGLPGQLPKFEKPKGIAPAYIGMSVSNTKSTFRFDLFVPAEAVKIARKAAETDQ